MVGTQQSLCKVAIQRYNSLLALLRQLLPLPSRHLTSRFVWQAIAVRCEAQLDDLHQSVEVKLLTPVTQTGDTSYLVPSGICITLVDLHNCKPREMERVTFLVAMQ